MPEAAEPDDTTLEANRGLQPDRTRGAEQVVAVGERRQSQRESPWLSRPKRPHGVGRTRRKSLPRNVVRSCGERCGTLAEDVVHQLARLVAEAHDRDNDTT